MEPDFGRLSRVLEGVNLYVYGDSQAKNPSQGADAGTQFSDRLSIRHHFHAYDNRGVAGTNMAQIAAAANASWVANSRGLALVCSGIGNSSSAWGADGQATAVRAFRTIMAVLTSRAMFDVGAPAFAFDGNWVAGASSTADAVFDFGVNGDACDLIVMTSTGGGGTLEVRDGATLVATIVTGGYEAALPGAFHISGLGSGDHILRATLTTGSATISGVAIPSPTPARVAWVTVEPSRNNVAQRQSYVDACLAVLADFPSVTHVTPGEGWEPALHISDEDGLHLNDRGNAFMADRIEQVLADELAFSQGLNRLTGSGAAPSYTGPIPDPIIIVTTYAADNFDRVDGALGSTTEGGLSWTSDKIQIVSNSAKAVEDASSTGERAYIDDGESEGVWRAVITQANIGMFFCGDESNAGYYAMWSGSAGAWRVGKVSGGFTPIETASASPAPSGSSVEVHRTGESIVLYVNGAEVMSVEDASYTGTRHGLIAAGFAIGQVQSWSHSDS